MSPIIIPTVFDIDIGGGVPGVNPYSARGLTGTLSPIALAQGDDKLARTVNGTLISIAAPQMRKYRLDASGSDVAAPALEGLWVGMQAIVNCHVELVRLTGAVATRSAVPGTVYTDGDYTYYCPQMTMLIVEWEVERHEWASQVNWRLALEEV